VPAREDKPDDCDLWLDPGVKGLGRVSDCLRSFDARFMKKYAVSTHASGGRVLWMPFWMVLWIVTKETNGCPK
jgi:hypothetical protein